MKRKLTLTLCLLAASIAMLAQQPHKEVGYDKSTNMLTTVAYGYGNSVDQIIFKGKDQTSIKVNNYGFPTEMVNSLTTVEFQYAGTSSVTVTQTVNGEKKIEVAWSELTADEEAKIIKAIDTHWYELNQMIDDVFAGKKVRIKRIK